MIGKTNGLKVIMAPVKFNGLTWGKFGNFQVNLSGICGQKVG